MNDYKKLIEIVKKEVVTLKEFQYITNHDFVAEVVSRPSDGRHVGCAKYIVKYINSDSDAIYVKRD